MSFFLFFFFFSPFSRSFEQTLISFYFVTVPFCETDRTTNLMINNGTWFFFSFLVLPFFPTPPSLPHPTLTPSLHVDKLRFVPVISHFERSTCQIYQMLFVLNKTMFSIRVPRFFKRGKKCNIIWRYFYRYIFIVIKKTRKS